MSRQSITTTYLFPIQSPETPINFSTLAVRMSPDAMGTRQSDFADKSVIIRAEIEKYDWNSQNMLKIAECESNFNLNAFNPELEAKKRWKETSGKSGTPYSSCGLFQVNSSECIQTGSILYDLEVNVYKAYQKWQSQNYYAWKNCAKKLKLL